jgi:hypothetical protein
MKIQLSDEQKQIIETSKKLLEKSTQGGLGNQQYLFINAIAGS